MSNNIARILGYKLSSVILDDNELLKISGSAPNTTHSTFLATSHGEVAYDVQSD